jgi:hypothetical protein
MGSKSVESARRAALRREYREAATEAAAARTKVLAALDAKCHEDATKITPDSAEVLAKVNGEFGLLAAERRAAIAQMYAAAAIEQLQVAHAKRRAERAEALEVPSFATWLGQRVIEGDELVAQMFEEERRREERAAARENLSGERSGDLSAVSLEGLVPDNDPASAGVRYSRDNKEVIVDTGARLDVNTAEERDIEAALRIAAQKFDMEKGLRISGNPGFRRKAAEIAGRLGIKVQDEDLRKVWDGARKAAPEHLALPREHETALLSPDEKAAVAALTRHESETAPVTPDGMKGGQRALGSAQSADAAQAVDQDAGSRSRDDYPAPRPGHARGEFELARLPAGAWESLKKAERGEPLTAEDRESLRRPGGPELVDAKGSLTEDGEAAYQAMRLREQQDEEDLRQTQLRLRNETLAEEAEEERQAAERQAAARTRQTDAAELGA